MTADEIPWAYSGDMTSWFDCPGCKGNGEVPDGPREPDTGHWPSRQCDWCDGDGIVDEERFRLMTEAIAEREANLDD